MTAALLIGLALVLTLVAVWSEHFRGRSWRQGLDRMLGRRPLIAGSSDDLGVKVGDTIELAHDLCDLCGHERGSHRRMRGAKFASYEDRCLREMGRFEICKCGRFTRFHQLTRWQQLRDQFHVPFWLG